MLAMTSWSGGVNTGCPRVKNLSKFSAPLPHCKRTKKERKKTEKISNTVSRSADFSGRMQVLQVIKITFSFQIFEPKQSQANRGAFN